ncbi:zinc-responsive transcriptional regulator [Pelotomaculum sp. FP]|uniref:MerR family transcriptional regulator n=1 Tax=Pelotomaculum sp. FP TaxID=261474 RepID=UPI001066D675|nr:MerR family transcriptional regulator [Pelotomaculum sp. FP]TEB12286.1 zinc-responsive transcriptional regulator [Pelotomaculum sp. FP]
MKTYKTSQIAEKCRVHPNTVRQYEELGFLPPVPRADNGYRQYGELHLEHVLLVKTAYRSTWLGGVIRQKALAVLSLSAAGSYKEAMRAAQEHLALVSAEREKAEIAARFLEEWAAVSDNLTGSDLRSWKTKDIANRLDITLDMLRSWERNGLISVPRNQDNGYRYYGEHEIRRLYVIRALRKARFSLMSIYTMFCHYDRGIREGLTGILNELPPDEENIFYNTNEWLTKIRSIEQSAHELISRLTVIKNLCSL